MVDDWKEHSKKFNVMTDFKYWRWVNRLSKLLSEAEKIKQRNKALEMNICLMLTFWGSPVLPVFEQLSNSLVKYPGVKGDFSEIE